MTRPKRVLRTHPHLCPICKQAFECAGQKCAPYNGVPHPTCSNARVTRYVIVVPRRCPECDAEQKNGKCYTNGCSLAQPEFTNYQE